MYGKVAAARERAREGIERAFAAEHTAHEIAVSFAIGTVITALPTGGTALFVFVAIAYLFERVSKLALFATLVVFNPVVKWSVYGASFWLGTRLLGPVPGATLSDVSLSAGPAIVVRQLLGNVVLAVVLAAVGYVAVLLLVHGYRRRVEAVGPVGPTELPSETTSD